MQGDLVLVRGPEDQPLLRWIWASDEDLIYLCEDDQFEKLKDGWAAAPPATVPRKDVFEFNYRLVAALRDAYKGGDRKRLMRLWTLASPIALARKPR